VFVTRVSVRWILSQFFARWSMRSTLDHVATGAKSIVSLGRLGRIVSVTICRPWESDRVRRLRCRNRDHH